MSILGKYKYYLRKPKGEIVKDILVVLALSGVLVAAGGPAVSSLFWQKTGQHKKYPKKKFCDTFTRLQKRGLLTVEKSGHNLKITLTPKGERLAGYMQIDKLEIKRPQKWDGFWRLILFDISNLKTQKRNAFRGILREVGFIPLQKSVWAHAFDCIAEIELLKDFFGLREGEVRLILAKTIGSDDRLRQRFHI